MQPTTKTATKTSGLRFSLRSLLLLSLLVACFLAGYTLSRWSRERPQIEGNWQLTLPSGATHPIEFRDVGQGEYHWIGGTVLSGVYRLRDGHLIVARPNDERMVGLTWRRSGGRWALISEPDPPPTGSSYAGAILTPRVEGD